MAKINNLIISLIRQSGLYNAAQARRFFADYLFQAFSCLVPPFPDFITDMEFQWVTLV
jgi:hypothetical protein